MLKLQTCNSKKLLVLLLALVTLPDYSHAAARENVQDGNHPEHVDEETHAHDSTSDHESSSNESTDMDDDHDAPSDEDAEEDYDDEIVQQYALRNVGPEPGITTLRVLPVMTRSAKRIRTRLDTPLEKQVATESSSTPEPEETSPPSTEGAETVVNETKSLSLEGAKAQNVTILVQVTVDADMAEDKDENKEAEESEGGGEAKSQPVKPKGMKKKKKKRVTRSALDFERNGVI